MKAFAFFCLLVIGGMGVNAQTVVDNMFPNVVISREHYDFMLKDLKENPETAFPSQWYYSRVKKTADDLLSSGWNASPVVSVDDNPDKVDISAEMEKIYLLCLTFAFEQDNRYLDKAVESLKAWAAVNKPLSKRNIHEECYNNGVEGYSIIRKVIDASDRNIIDGWVRKRADQFVSDNDIRINNWTTCLMHQFFLYGKVLEDEDVYNMYKNQYGGWVKNNLFPNGTTTDLLGRDAFAYHAYDLMFFGRITHLIALYEGYDAADRFYTQDINLGASVKKSVDFWKPFCLNPDKYTHVEFVETEYEPDKNRNDYNKTYSPSGTLYAMDPLYEFDQSLDDVFNKYGRNPMNAHLDFGISYLRWYYNE